MTRPVSHTLLLLAVATLLPAGCKKSTTEPTATELVFTFSPIAPGEIERVESIGAMNPDSHTLPTNHGYFYRKGGTSVVTVPADGVVTEVRRESDDSIRIKATSRITYYFFHMFVDANIVVGTRVTAGQRLGQTNVTLDLGVVNMDVTQPFVQSGRYIDDTRHADDMWRYFSADLRATLGPLYQRPGADKSGQICFDQAGRLAGNWFHESLPADQNTELVANGPRHLSIGRDHNAPDNMQVSIGSQLFKTTAYLGDGSPDPGSVSQATGRVGYQLVSRGNRQPVRVLVVQLLADDRLRIETFPVGTPLSADFTAAAQVYIR